MECRNMKDKNNIKANEKSICISLINKQHQKHQTCNHSTEQSQYHISQEKHASTEQKAGKICHT